MVYRGDLGSLGGIKVNPAISVEGSKSRRLPKNPTGTEILKTVRFYFDLANLNLSFQTYVGF